MHQPANALCCREKCIRPKHTFQLEPLQDGEYFNGLMDAQKATCKDQMNLFDVAATHLLILLDDAGKHRYVETCYTNGIIKPIKNKDKC